MFFKSDAVNTLFDFLIDCEKVGEVEEFNVEYAKFPGGIVIKVNGIIDKSERDPRHWYQRYTVLKAGQSP